MKYFGNFDFKAFWRESEYSKENYEDVSPTDEMVKSLEEQLGYRLPISYVEFMRVQNGGFPNFDCHSAEQSTSWSNTHVAISGFLSVGRKNGYSIGHEYGGQSTVEEWGYPQIGIMICDCPSAGHDIIMLDYRECGNDGEPQVVHVDEEFDYKITVLAKDFESFVRGLKLSQEFEVE